MEDDVERTMDLAQGGFARRSHAMTDDKRSAVIDRGNDQS
jgi:hypothetical protein